MTITPEVLEEELSLSSAAARLEFLSRRNDVAPADHSPPDQDAFFSDVAQVGAGLDRPESLELVALSEMIARRAAASRHRAVTSALRTGAGWELVAAALGSTPPAAHDEHLAWIRAQERAEQDSPGSGLDAAAAAEARRLAGERPR